MARGRATQTANQGELFGASQGSGSSGGRGSGKRRGAKSPSKAAKGKPAKAKPGKAKAGKVKKSPAKGASTKAKPARSQKGAAASARSKAAVASKIAEKALAAAEPDVLPEPLEPARRGRKAKAPKRRTAQDLAGRQREISVSEFFTKNRHLLGFDSPGRALLTAVKEAVDNALDACEEVGVRPDLVIEIQEVHENRFRIAVEDNGPGIVRAQVPRIFGKLLYGSKFHAMKQSLTSEQPVVVERNGRVDRLPIGQLVDGFLDDAGDEAGAASDSEAVVDVTSAGLRVPAFDPATWKYAWRPVSHVIRHRRENEILEVRTQNGKRVRVTGCHSLFTYDAEARRVRSVEARDLRPGHFIVAPRQIPAPSDCIDVNLLNELAHHDVKGRYLYVYGIDPDLLTSLRQSAEVIHKKLGKRSRRYYRLRDPSGGTVDVLDDSFAQYLDKGFLPAHLVKRLGLTAACADARLRTYHHGRMSETPVTWRLTPELMRFFGLYVAEGHSDRRQIGFTFGAHEVGFVDEVVATATELGLSTTVEERERNAVRVKVFGPAVGLLFPTWCGRGAREKRVPEFVFRADRALRQHFLDGLYDGDGHRAGRSDALMFVSSSQRLVDDVELLWALQGVVASRLGSFRQQGLGRNPSTSWKLDVHGMDIAKSNVLTRRAKRDQLNRYRMMPAAALSLAAGGARVRVAPEADAIVRAAGMGAGPAGAAKATARSLFESDLCLLEVREIEPVSGEHPWVYDLSVPGCENFVAGEGLIACHNSRGQQGIGISAAGMYGQLTTGKPVVIRSRTSARKPAHYFELVLDTAKNQPKILVDREEDWEGKSHGTRVEIELEGTYRRGSRSVDAYVALTAMANPHASIRYHPPKDEPIHYARATDVMPVEPKEIKPHPYGVELGMLIKMMHTTKARQLSAALQSDFSRVSLKVAQEICEKAKLKPTMRPGRIGAVEAEALQKAIAETRILAPPTSCVSPIGEGLMLEGLRAGLAAQDIEAEFTTSTTRSPAIYRGNPFQVEVALAWGGNLPGDELAVLNRFANRVPLQYQQAACAITKAVMTAGWRNYGLQQSRGALPTAPLIISVHIASVWVPFTSEAKEAIASYPEILKELRLALQECGRRLGRHIRKRRRLADEARKRSHIELFIPIIGEALQEILALTDKDREATVSELAGILERSRTAS